ncbi:Arm DNA-binding domain-containing protein [Tardiphaga sp.]|uniref:Arm DNA-binding domain-containing protein n=1 Tax=Tardiphaga sp. TaxID=1926292 RepID=UPI002604EE8E|nr:Arm DNA-binding domain-containing protein [Tardiphaga sp.]MDB5615919.1 hypothetical protein [Tardiphaga sp.]
MVKIDPPKPKKKRGLTANSLAKLTLPVAQSEFTETMLLGMAAALKTGRLKVDKLAFSDDVQHGLRAIVRKTGTITLHAHYEIGESRPMLKVGDLPGSTIAEARKITKTVRALAAKGIDVQDGMLPRLLRELREQGENWRP